MILKQLKFTVVLMVAVVMVGGIATSADNEKEQPKKEERAEVKQPQLTKGSTEVTFVNTARLRVGMSVTGVGIPANTIVIAINATDKLGLSSPATQTGPSVLTFRKDYIVGGTLTAGTATVTDLADTTPSYAGMAVAGMGIPAGTTVSAIVNGTTLTLSNNATANGKAQLTFSAVIQMGKAEEPKDQPKKDK